MSERRAAMQFGIPPKKDHKPLIICGAAVTLAIILSATTPKDTSPSPNFRTNPDGAKGSSAALIVEAPQPTPAPLEPEFPLNPGEKLMQWNSISNPLLTDDRAERIPDEEKRVVFTPEFATTSLNNVDYDVITGQIIQTPSEQYVNRIKQPNGKQDDRPLVVNEAEKQFYWKIPDAYGQSTTLRLSPKHDTQKFVENELGPHGDPLFISVQFDDGHISALTKDKSEQQSLYNGEDLIWFYNTQNPNNICQQNNNKIAKIRYLPYNEVRAIMPKGQKSRQQIEQKVDQSMKDHFNGTGTDTNITPHKIDLPDGRDCTEEPTTQASYWMDNVSESEKYTGQGSDFNAQTQKLINEFDQEIKTVEQALEDAPSIVPRQIMRDKANIERIQIGLIPLLNVLWSAAGFIIYFPKKTRKLGTFILGLGSVIGFCNLGLAYAQKAIEMLLFVPQIAIALLSGLAAATQLKLLEKQAQRQ